MDIKLELSDTSEILRYLEYHGQEMDEKLHNQILTCIERINAVAMPRFVHMEVEMETTGEIPPICDFFTGEDIKKHVSDCHRMILMAATLGIALDNAIRKVEVRDMADALIMDACASTLIEAYCDSIEAQFREHAAQKKEFLTYRYSPGYGDLPIGIQKRFVNLINATRRIGLNVSDSGIMTPRKSVTAIIGIAKQPKVALKRTCKGCNLNKSCRFLRRGVRCYG